MLRERDKLANRRTFRKQEEWILDNMAKIAMLEEKRHKINAEIQTLEDETRRLRNSRMLFPENDYQPTQQIVWLGELSSQEMYEKERVRIQEHDQESAKQEVIQ